MMLCKLLPLTLVSLVSLVSLISRPIVADESDLQTSVAPVLARYCVQCHSGQEPESGLDLTALPTRLEDPGIRQRWITLYDRLADGEMPPESAHQPDAEERRVVLESLGTALIHAERSHREVVLRRLNRQEYEFTVRDLFGVHVDVQDILPDDSVEQGFDTIGSSLSLSTEQILSYLEAADAVLDEVLAPHSLLAVFTRP